MMSRGAGELVAGRLRGRNARIYEAGGGSLSLLPPSLLEASTISVVDIDEVQLNNNKYADIKIQGDIQTYFFSRASFDLVVCNQVIEHLDHPDQAIRLFVDMLAPGGILFIGAPHPASFSGLVTRFSPHWFHVWFYRSVMGSPTAGQPGFAPFRTVYHRLVHPTKLTEFCERLGLSVIYFREFPHWTYVNLQELRPLLGSLLYGIVGLLNLLTLGRRDLRNGDYQIVFEKRTEH
jgi:2-polyprenyl-3-methyl-5-hydroxy-6-metoxy-1,4-benzoquinol methylase